MFIAALFPIAKIWNQPRFPSIHEWIKKMWCIQSMEYYSVIKKNEIKWVELEIMLSEKSQTEKDKYHVFSRMLNLVLKNE
jgi:hypothetical protein